MKPFEYYIKEKSVRKVSVDIELAKALKKDLFGRIEKAIKLDKKEYSKIVFESMYDSLREFCDVLLALDGYKSYSHEAAIAYLKNYGFDDAEIFTLDRYRFKRNGSKYYGKEITEEDTLDIDKFYKDRVDKIKSILNEKFAMR
jgi:hypothetical protein